MRKTVVKSARISKITAVFAIFLISFLLFPIFSTTNLKSLYAADPPIYTDGTFKFTLFDSNATIVSGYTGSNDVVIPDTIYKDSDTGHATPYTVISIGTSAFSGNSTITSIIIPNTVKSISDSAFEGCIKLGSVTFTASSTVTSIGQRAFGSCTNLTSISIPSSVTSINNFAFSDCKGLGSVTFTAPSTVTTIGYSAFNGCTGLTSIIIPSTLTIIDSGTFYGTGLKSIIIPSTVASIGTYAFGNCTSLTSITFNSATTTIYNSAETISAAAKIIGYDPSTAKAYATKYVRTFEAIAAPEVAAGITTISAPSKDATSLTLPTVPAGFTIAIKSSNPSGVIALNGTIVPPVVDTAVALVLTVTKTSDSTTADTASINVVVPAKTAAPSSSAPPRPLTPEEIVALSLTMQQQINTYGATANGFTKMLYDNVLGRVPEDEGLNGWEANLNNTMTGSQIAYYFIFSEELAPTINSLSDNDFIAFLYTTLMNRPYDEAGYAGWQEKMGLGMTREELVNHFVNSPEFAGICTLFNVTP